MSLEHEPQLEKVPSDDPVVEMGAEELEQMNQEVDEVVHLNEPDLQELSEIEKLDIEVGTTSGWIRYWRDRLVTELSVLPDDIKLIVRNMAQDIKLSEQEHSILYKYIRQRVMSLKIKTPIIQIQEGKQLEMAKLKERLWDIDLRNEYKKNEQKRRKIVFYDQEADQIFVVENDARKNLTVGDIVADYDWGIKYRPDYAMPDKLWRRIRKLSDYIEARRNIEKLFNREISLAEGVSAGVTRTLEELISQTIVRRHKKDHWDVGNVAERMVPSFLLRVQYNHPELGFKVEYANVLEDAELKYDFKVSFSIRLRGVAVEGDDEDGVEQKRNLGVQFTTRTRGLGKKRSQVEDAKKIISEPKYSKYIKRQVDDIVLVSLSFRDCVQNFQEWFSAGRPSGGPEQYMSTKVKKEILKKIFQDRIELTDEEIDSLIE